VKKATSKIVGAFGALLLSSTSHAAVSAPEKPAFDRSILHIQVILDKLGFAPGVLDGMGGKSLVAALKGFQTANNLTVTGIADAETLKALYPYRNWRPTVSLPLSADVLAGPFVNPLPKDPLEQAKLPALAYRNAVEALAERFHTTPATLVTLNPGAKLAVGTRLTFPNAIPTSRAYDVKDATWLATLQSLNVGAIQPKAKRIVVDKSESVLQVYDDKDKLVAQFPATMGSTHDPLPIGSWTIKGISYNPKFHYNASLFWDASDKDEKATLPSGPNGPVGVVWIDLSKPHYGIHGTPSPETISRAESHGCIRLTNWDAARLALMVKSGVPAVFQP
jgi:lipoprotein-anchoring transpeptidase ErfK/SrfK